MSTIGYYRYKIAAVSSAGNSIVFSVGGTPTKTVTVTPQNLCTGKRILKYLNRDGQYRFYAFSNYYEEIDTPKEIGKVNKLITSILSSKSNISSVGYKSDRTISLISEPIPTNELEMLRDIYTSPRVYLYIGASTDLDSDWLEVTIRADKSIRKERKAKFTTLQIDVILPETYSISML